MNAIKECTQRDEEKQKHPLAKLNQERFHFHRCKGRYTLWKQIDHDKLIKHDIMYTLGFCNFMYIQYYYVNQHFLLSVQ